MDKISTIKKNILLFIENQGFKKEDFFNKIGISYSNFKGKSLQSEISSEKLVTIITMFPNLNPEWLLTRKGEMLRSEFNIPEPIEKLQVEEPKTAYKKEDVRDKLIMLQEETITDLKTRLKECEEEKKMTENNINVSKL